jgi:hypothetical protein
MYLLLFVSYLVTLTSLIWDFESPSKLITHYTWTSVIIGWAEFHLIALGLLGAIWGYYRWAARIPITFDWLRQPPRRLYPISGDFDCSYMEYLNKYQQALLSKKYSIISSLTLICILALFLLVISNDLAISRIFTNIPYLLMLMFSLLWAYFAGIGAWPVYVTMRYVKKLTRCFHVEIQPSHPDKSGGLEPLGDFCFAMSLPMLIGGITLSVVSVGGLVLFYSDAGSDLYESIGITGNFDPTFAFASLVVLILFAMPLIAFTFFMPLWDIHRYMKTCKREAQDDYANRVAMLEKRIRSRIDMEDGLDESKVAKDKLGIIEETLNPNKTGYPVWPFRPTIVIKLFSPQIISIAGFALSVYEAIK